MSPQFRLGGERDGNFTVPVPNSLLEIGGFARDSYWDGHAEDASRWPEMNSRRDIRNRALWSARHVGIARCARQEDAGRHLQAL